MKRKHDEGYALVFALVVLLFLSIVAMSMMQLTGRDLNAQIASIDRMKAQYAAQGELEKKIGILENNSGEKNLTQIFGSDLDIEGDMVDTSRVTAVVHISHNAGPGEYQVLIECKLRMIARDGSRFFTEDSEEDVVYKLNGSCIVEYLSFKMTSEKIPEATTAPSEGGSEGGVP